MPKYFFNVRDQDDELIIDREGQTFPDMEEARAEAVRASREMLGEKLLHGGALDSRRIEVTDEAGTVLTTVRVDDVLFREHRYRSYSDDVTKSAPVAHPASTKSRPE